MKQKELELENESGSDDELEYFFKGKKLSAQQRGFVIIAYSGKWFNMLLYFNEC